MLMRTSHEGGGYVLLLLDHGIAADDIVTTKITCLRENGLIISFFISHWKKGINF